MEFRKITTKEVTDYLKKWVSNSKSEQRQTNAKELLRRIEDGEYKVELAFKNEHGERGLAIFAGKPGRVFFVGDESDWEAYKMYPECDYIDRMLASKGLKT